MSVMQPPPVTLSEKLRQGNVLQADCPSRGVLKHVTSRWGLLALILLLEGTFRFSELRRGIGSVSEKMLAQTLQALEHDGFVTRHALPIVPPHVEYSLTPLGKEVAERAQNLADWIEGNIQVVLRMRAEHDRSSSTVPTE